MTAKRRRFDEHRVVINSRRGERKFEWGRGGTFQNVRNYKPRTTSFIRKSLRPLSIDKFEVLSLLQIRQLPCFWHLILRYCMV